MSPMAAVRIGPMLELGWRVHRWLFRVSGGRLGDRMNGFDVLLLTTTGRRSGSPRRAALQYLPHGTGWAVVASRAGDDRNPDWWHNLVAMPLADVLVGGSHHAVVSRDAVGQERDALFARFAAVDPAYLEYERRTTRTIPVVVLEPNRRQGTV
jgi:deazaflavin-dependent oxidoreductase (nitroreductase family)